MITHDEAIETIDNIFMCVKSNGDYDDNCVDYNLQSVRKALERAKKEHELLGLYRECNEEGHFWLEIQGRISKLEEELK